MMGLKPIDEFCESHRINTKGTDNIVLGWPSDIQRHGVDGRDVLDAVPLGFHHVLARILPPLSVSVGGR